MSSSEESNESRHYCLAISALNKAVSDTEKFGALFVVINVLKDKQLNCEQNLKLFESIESEFLCRLLLSNGESDEIPDGCKPYIFQSIGVSIITSFFMTITDSIDSKTCVQLLTSITIVLKQLKDKQNLDENEKQMLNDIIICFESFISSNQINQMNRQLINSLFESKFDEILSEMYSNDFFSEQKISINDLLSKLANSIEWSAFNPKPFNDFMTRIATDFKAKQDKHKFELCKELKFYLKRNVNHCIKHNSNEWMCFITDGLFDIFRSRLNKDLRDPALELAATLTEMFNGFHWISNNNWNETNAKLFLLLLRLSCIEIAINFESENIDMCCVANCFVILEHSVVTIANDSEEMVLIKYLTQEEIYDMLTAIRDTMSVIIEYLRRISAQNNEINTKSDVFISILASIRVLCVWVTEETEALREEIAEILPFILKVFRITDKSELSISNIIISALISFAENDKLKLILLHENIIDFIINTDFDSDHNKDINLLIKSLKQLLLS